MEIHAAQFQNPYEMEDCCRFPMVKGRGEDPMISVVFPDSLLAKAFSLQLAVATTASEDSQNTRKLSGKLWLLFLQEQIKIKERTFSRYVLTEEKMETRPSCMHLLQ